MAKKSEEKKTLVLLDSHAVLHRAFHALPSFTSPKGEATGALYGFTSMLLKIIKELKPDYLAACYDLPEPTFRHQVYAKYKATRPKMDDELSSQIEKSKLILGALNIPIYEKAGFEADDILASVVWQMKDENVRIVIVTGDMDTLQLVRPGVEVYAMKKGIQEAVFYNERAVKERYGFGPKLLPDFKGLMGDPSDNIIGVPGIGEKTAKILIQGFGTIENIYKKLKANRDLFAKAGITERIIKILEESEEEALFSKALAETRADVPISFSLKQSIWEVGFDKEKISCLFQDLGFKSLLKRLLSEEEKNVLKNDNLDEGIVRQFQVGFWLLDSRRINPDVQEVFDFVKTNSLEEVRKKLQEALKKDGLWKLYQEVEFPLVAVLGKMEKNGILLDTVYLQKLSKDYHKKIDEIEQKIWEMAGEKFNVASPKQLGSILFEKMGIIGKGMRRTTQGARSTRFSELAKIEDKHPIIKEIFLHRELSKLTSTYIDNLPKMVDSANRLHTSFNQAGTTTGRLSSSEPNLQNIPKRTDFGLAVRRAFIASEGSKLVSFDYSQIELRVAAFLSGDKKLKQAFIEGKDIHSQVASEVFNTPFDKVTSEMRRRAKIINFGILYGMGINSLRKNLNCSVEEAERFYLEYFSDFSGMANYMEKTKEEVRKNGFTQTYFGRRRYLPEINSHLEFMRKEAERMAINAPIQGTAADILKIAMVKLDKVLVEENLYTKVRPLLQVHDELLFEMENGIIKKAVPMIKKIMEEDKLPGVPLVVETLVGANWSELEKYKF